jgi:hypothetical protein
MPTAAHLLERDALTERKDVFKAPYNPNLYVGELRDEDEDGGTEYVVMVSEFLRFFAIWIGNPPSVRMANRHLLPPLLHPPVPVVAQQVLCR